ncbi:MAG: DUF4230 domain-containing protein [Alphaproteobacteria bacterium]|nr:MAG: DUF4230 domain-containing protein [Alphaproteobacteria bacterium]
MKKAAFIVPAVVIGILIGALLVGSVRISDWFRGPDPESIATASLQSVKEQSRLVAFAARFVAVVTSTQTTFGLSARKTLIMPGTVRYEIDLARLQQGDMKWDDNSKTLAISLPPLEISEPEVQLDQLQEYDGGGLLMRLTNAEGALDAANRKRGQQELARQAGQPMPLKLARDAARRAVERSFAMPLRAAGVQATVVARFRDDAAADPSQLDRSRRIEDVLNSSR